MTISLPHLSVAQDLQTVVLSHSVEVTFPPEEAFILVELEGTIRKIRAILIPPFSKDETDQKQGNWWIGATIKVYKGHEPLNYSIVLKGKDKEISTVLSLVGGSSKDTFEAIPLLKAAINLEIERKKSWDVQITAQEASLRRQRADADVIANVSRIVDVLEETEGVKYEMENLDRDIASLHEAFKQAKNPPTPKNFSRRELDLTKQTAELAQVAKNMESGEGTQKVKLQNDLQRKLAIVEATRYEDEAQLKSELLLLQARQQRVGNGVERGNNYWDSQ